MLEKTGVSPVKIRRLSCPSSTDKEELAASIDKIKNISGDSTDRSRIGEINPDKKNAEELRVLFDKQENYRDKILVLTSVPESWTIKKFRGFFHVSRRIAISAKKIRKSKGIGSWTEEKKGRPIDPKIIEAVQSFYLSDQISHIMPGVRDFKSVKNLELVAKNKRDF